MRLFDLHCDTLYRAYTENSTLFNDDFHISFNRANFINPYIQCLAVWIPDEYRGNSAWELFLGCIEKLKEQISGTDIKWCKSFEDIKLTEENCKKGIILTVEGGAVLGGDIEKIQTLYDIGVRMMTLTWNGENEFGDGIGIAENRGLTDFGKAALCEMERVGIIIDISHAGEKMFWDTAEITKKPFAASHSNIRSVSPHKRNLTNEQFLLLKERKGIAGINFCAEFLNKNKTNAQMYDIIRTAESFLELGGEDTIAIGGDFDGADIPSDMTGIESMQKLNDMFVSEFGSGITEKIFFRNAQSFFSKFL